MQRLAHTHHVGRSPYIAPAPHTHVCAHARVRCPCSVPPLTSPDTPTCKCKDHTARTSAWALGILAEGVYACTEWQYGTRAPAWSVACIHCIALPPSCMLQAGAAPHHIASRGVTFEPGKALCYECLCAHTMSLAAPAHTEGSSRNGQEVRYAANGLRTCRPTLSPAAGWHSHGAARSQNPRGWGRWLWTPLTQTHCCQDWHQWWQCSQPRGSEA